MKIDEYVIVDKYAQAFMRVFAHQLQAEVIPPIRSAARYLATKPSFAHLLLFLTGKPHQMQEIMMSRYLQHLRLPDFCAPLFFLLLKKKRISLLSFILERILKLWYDKKQVLTIALYAPQVLSEHQKNSLIRFIEQKRNKKVIFSEFILQPELIAGIKIVSSDGYIWEYSLLKQITKITAILRQEGIRRES
jgi:F0F1-type ATP synthase delta subunit